MSSPNTPAPAPRCLYTLNDTPLTVSMGQFGDWVIEPKPEGAPWGVTLVESINVRIDLGDDKSEPRWVTATELVNDIVSRYSADGLFLAAQDDKPSPQEVKQAETEFELADLTKIAEGNVIWDNTHNRSKIGPKLRAAARRRHQPVEWAGTAMFEQKECQYCGELVRATAIKCKHCNEFLDGRSTQTPAAETAHAALEAAGGKRR